MSIQSLYFSPYSNLAAQALRSGAAQRGLDGVRGADAQSPIEEISKIGRQNSSEKDDSRLKPGEIASPGGDILSLSEKTQEADNEEKDRLKSGNAADVETAVGTQQNSVQQDDAAENVKSANGTEAEKELTEEEKQQVGELKLQDTEVRNHEAAHLAAAGQYATSGASYTYQTGPDGQKYAVGGEVSIDVSPVAGDPEATIQKAQQVRTAALAPNRPSSQDYKVAANASKMEAEARTELQRQKAEEVRQSQDGKNQDETAVDSPTNGPLSQKTNSVASKYLSQTLSSHSSVSSRSQFQAIA